MIFMNTKLISTTIYIYQPETCDTANELMHEKEDHCHVLKRITERLCSGTIPNVDLCCFRDALSDQVDLSPYN